MDNKEFEYLGTIKPQYFPQSKIHNLTNVTDLIIDNLQNLYIMDKSQGIVILKVPIKGNLNQYQHVMDIDEIKGGIQMSLRKNYTLLVVEEL